MSMREKAKSMWEKSQMSVGKAMSSAVTNLAGYVSSMWNKNSEPENPGNLLTGVPISVPKPMEGNEVGDKPVEITNTNINEQGEKVTTSYFINADNTNSIAKTTFEIGNNRLDSVPNLVYKSIVNGETVLVVIDPPILEILGIDIETMRIALKTENR